MSSKNITYFEYLISCKLTISRQLFESKIAFYSRILILLCFSFEKIYRARGAEPPQVTASDSERCQRILTDNTIRIS